MRFAIVAALALAAASSLHAQVIPDLGTASVLPGDWSFAFATGGSEATFTDNAGNPQLWLHCTRVTRRVSIAKRGTGATPFLQVWTSSTSPPWSPPARCAPGPSRRPPRMLEALEPTREPGWVLSHEGYNVLTESATSTLTMI